VLTRVQAIAVHTSVQKSAQVRAQVSAQVTWLHWVWHVGHRVMHVLHVAQVTQVCWLQLVWQVPHVAWLQLVLQVLHVATHVGAHVKQVPQWVCRVRMQSGGQVMQVARTQTVTSVQLSAHVAPRVQSVRNVMGWGRLAGAAPAGAGAMRAAASNWRHPARQVKTCWFSVKQPSAVWGGGQPSVWGGQPHVFWPQLVLTVQPALHVGWPHWVLQVWHVATHVFWPQLVLHVWQVTHVFWAQRVKQVCCVTGQVSAVHSPQTVIVGGGSGGGGAPPNMTAAIAGAAVARRCAVLMAPARNFAVVVTSWARW
jgi:hypothetical protein